MTHDMTHDEFLVAYLEAGRDGPDERAHLDTCASCREVVAELDITRAALAEPFAWDDPDPSLEDAVVAAITDATRTTGQHPARERADSPREHGERREVAESAGVVDLQARIAGATRRSRRFAQAAAGVAAAACLVAVLAVATRPSGDPVAGPPVVSVTTTDPLAGAVELTLAGTGLVPDVSGRVQMVETPSGVRIHLDAANLPRRDGGDFYQAWLRGDGGLVPVGTFHSGEDVWLWAGVAVRDFPTFTVTEESADGNQESSGRRVLIGTL